MNKPISTDLHPPKSSCYQDKGRRGNLTSCQDIHVHGKLVSDAFDSSMIMLFSVSGAYLCFEYFPLVDISDVSMPTVSAKHISSRYLL